MKIIIHGPAAGYFWDGTIHSWGLDELVEIDDSNEQAVAWARSKADSPLGEIVEDVQETPPEPTLQDLKVHAEVLGLPTYGSKTQLAERIAKREQEV